MTMETTIDYKRVICFRIYYLNIRGKKHKELKLVNVNLPQHCRIWSLHLEAWEPGSK